MTEPAPIDLPLRPPLVDGEDLDALVLGGFAPSLRARQAESLAQLVLGDADVALPLRDLVRRAAHVTGAETGQLSLLSTRQIAVVVERGSAELPDVGQNATGATSAFEDTICAVSFRADASIRIPDTRCDARVASVPAVVDGVVGSYLGSPVRTVDGAPLGVLCVYNAGPRSWAPEDSEALDAAALEMSRALAELSATLTPSAETRPA